MKNALKEVVGGFISLLTGLKITIIEFFKPTVTVQYPHQTLKIPARFRGHIELVRDPETGKAICFACKLCERACPSDCITVDGAKLDGAKKKSVTAYSLDFTKCSLCGSCVEACRDGAIRFSRAYNLASVNKEDYVMDLFKKLEDEAAADGAKSEIRNVKSEGNPKSEIQSTCEGISAGVGNVKSEVQSSKAVDGKLDKGIGIQLPAADAPRSTLDASRPSSAPQASPLSK
jgi:NADH-quinone oxidoreductase subunit I